ncbi:hypothetical protein QP547_00900 [Weeksella virosa]|uniref:hypothetical protein n=1 Tax=Weeksella virosa TaxID=1014 RepID=UPI002553A0CE|nr:hypothetical protein [Weeksella virosa]MDK7674368.1 hypothetical protein [Weeksella virosa]
MSNEIIKKKSENLPCLAVNQIGLFSNYDVDTQRKTIIEIERSVDLDQTLHLPAIQRLGKDAKRDVLVMIERALRMTTMMFKYAERMEDFQISIMASDLYDKFIHNSVEDIILMLRYARQGRLGGSKSVFDNDTLFNIYVPRYLDMKAEKWEKENEFIVKPEEKPLSEEEKARQQALIDQLHKAWRASRKPKKEAEVEMVDHHQQFIEGLPKLAALLTNAELTQEISRAKAAKVWDAHEIYKKELEKRKK